MRLGALVVTFPNLASWAFRCWRRLLGEQRAGAADPLALDMVVVTSLCIALSRWSLGASGQSAPTAPRARALRGIAVNPMLPGGAWWGWGRWPRWQQGSCRKPSSRRWPCWRQRPRR